MPTENTTEPDTPEASTEPEEPAKAPVVEIPKDVQAQLDVLSMTPKQVEEKAHTRMKHARGRMVLDQPFFATLALPMRLVCDWFHPCGTAYTNGEVLGYNPLFICSLPVKELDAVICHETLHVALMHMKRHLGKDFKLWLLATDYAVNGILHKMGIHIPQGWLYDSKYEGLTADQIYHLLQQEKKKQQQKQQKKGAGKGQGQGKGKGQGKGGNQSGTQIPDGTGGPPKGGNGQYQPGGQDAMKNGRPCGGAHTPMGKDGKPMNARQLAEYEEKMKKMLSRALQASKSKGNIPGELQSEIDEILEPKVRWEQHLRTFVSSSSNNRYTWAKPNRRHIPHGIFLPSAYGQSAGDLVFAIDTSGSISDKELSQFAGELTSILRDVPFDRLTIIHCDYHIQKIEEKTNDDLPLNLVAVGRGGTAFTPPFEWLIEQKRKPRSFVYLTDGYSNDFVERPPYPVLWVVTEDGDQNFSPPFGEVVFM